MSSPRFAELRQRWSPLLDDLPLDTRTLASLAAELTRRYAEPQRSYHGLAHIDALAALYRAVEAGPGWRVGVEVKLALLFHDAIYKAADADNEARSAALSRTYLESTPVDHERVAAMIRATKVHADASVADDHDLAHFLDADMAIIGVPSPAYLRYAAQVAEEFSELPPAMYRLGRVAFLRAQLARDHLFHTPYFRARYAEQARANIEAELARLSPR